MTYSINHIDPRTNRDASDILTDMFLAHEGAAIEAAYDSMFAAYDEVIEAVFNGDARAEKKHTNRAKRDAAKFAALVGEDASYIFELLELAY